MLTSEWVRRLPSRDDLREVFSDLGSTCEWRSICPEARPPFVAAAWLMSPRPTVIVVSSFERSIQWQAKLEICGIPGEKIGQLPSGISSLFEDEAPEHIALSDRLGALHSLARHEDCIVIATIQAALERTLPADDIVQAHIDLRPGNQVDPAQIESGLIGMGYEVMEPARLPGQFARRGGIIDVFASGHELPHRIELWDDLVESIRQFDPNSQRTVRKVERLVVSPSRETLFPGGESDTAEFLLGVLDREANNLDSDASKHLRLLVAKDAESLRARRFFDRLDLYRPILYPDSGSAIDLLGEDGWLILDEPLELEAIASRAEEDLGQALESRTSRGEILHSTAHDFVLPVEHIASHGKRLVLSSMNSIPAWLTSASAHEIDAASLEPYRGRGVELAHTIGNWLANDFTIATTTDQPNRAAAMLNQIEVFASPESEQFPMLSGNLAGGFALPHAKLAVISDAELFGVARLRMPQRRFMEGAPIATVLDLKPGDYVVHIHFGIGVFRGLVMRDELGTPREYLAVDYAHPDKLFVPADQLDRIQKYLNPGDEHPKLNRLRGAEWQKTIAKARADAQEFARDLIRIYAERRVAKRRPFGPDTPWQHELEATFPWVETPSQLSAIRDAKRDMMEDFPMDRLVCGDVGFGKTEVAVRAAFKAVQAGRQVAVLCPTTILSEQHFRTFHERLDPFGVRIEIVNRYRSEADRKTATANLKAGEIDIVIGTHALLGKNIQFKDLGLVVIDEEQRFGVKQKEMLKDLRAEVDVLTLSATPIPRTLSMALMDIRQMSLINDPPPGRLPIRTYLRPYSKEVVREAILREMARNGQVFYVYNRVESIEHVAEKVRRLVPTARVAVGHGQMTEAQIEPVMVGFIKGEVDILVSTTIVESGLDIPNANTLIVEDADRLGLAQLYQLRGRVGRSDRQAYAYLLHSSGKEMTEGALARLQALQEFSQLGSGYSLAFRDLQIRGAGDLLGAKQHGAIAAVGYELYTQLIAEAVERLKNTVDGAPQSSASADPLESVEPLPAFDASVSALIPETYIKDQAQRLFYYQRMMGARTEAELGEAQAEVEDRYGHPPIEVKNAYSIMGARMRSQRFGIERMEAKGGRILVSFKTIEEVPARVFTLMSRRNRDCFVNRESLVWPFTGAPLDAADSMLEALSESWREYEEAKASLGY